MLIGVFKSNQQLINIFAVLILTAVWVARFFFGDFNHPDFSLGYDWLNLVGGIGLITFQVFFTNRIVNEYKLLEIITHLPGFIIVTLNSVGLFEANFHQVLLANTFILLAFSQLLRLYGITNKFGVLFNAGIAVGLASMIYFPSVIYFLFIWIVLIYMTTPVWRDFAVSLIGFVLPLVYYITYFFVFKDLSELVFLTEHTKIFDFSFSQLSIWNKVFLFALACLTLVAGFKLLVSAGKSVARVRKILVAVLLYFIVSLTALFLNQFDIIATLILMIIPLSIMIANFFQHIKKTWLAEVIFLLFVLCIVLGYFS